MVCKCNKSTCLDKVSSTKVSLGGNVVDLNTFEDTIKSNPSMKSKMEDLENKLENY